MDLVQFIREILPHAYWSASFVACLIIAISVSVGLYALTRWNGWLLTCLAATLYVVPFIAQR